jgi:transposase
VILLKQFLPCLRLKGRKTKNISLVLTDDEIYHGIAKVADTIEKNDWTIVGHRAKLSTAK